MTTELESERIVVQFWEGSAILLPMRQTDHRDGERESRPGRSWHYSEIIAIGR